MKEERKVQAAHGKPQASDWLGHLPPPPAIPNWEGALS